jgi:hypothetical protein
MLCCVVCGVWCAADRKQTKVYQLSAFVDDDNDVVRSMLISNIKQAMAAGSTVLLMHTAPIHGSLYDLLNQHFTEINRRGEIVHYANIALVRRCLCASVTVTRAVL